MPAKRIDTPYPGVLVTIHSDKSYFDLKDAVEARFPRASVEKLTEYVTHADQKGFEAYMYGASAPGGFSIFYELEQGPVYRLAGIPIETKFYLIGNAVLAQDLFRHTAAAGLGAPVRICVSQYDGEQARIDLDLPTSFFGKFAEMKSKIPQILDERMVKMLEDAAG